MTLPIDAVVPDLQQALRERDEAVLVAEPGAGKTTRVPLVLLDEPWLGDRQILMLEPRRLAARAAAQRLAEQLGERVGETVGYRMRLDRKESKSTRMLVVTEGVLTRMLQSDPSLEGVGLLIFDEFHERSLDADLGLALSLYSRELFRDSLKILLMSATLDSEAVAGLLDDAPVVSSEGRSYPVDIRYGRRIDRRDLPEVTARQVMESLSNDQGSLLVFLPGQAEIRCVADALRERLAGDDTVIIAPLFGDLSLEEQRRAIEPAPAGKRKVVLATTIAESSLTIDGVTVVIDGGFARVPRFDPRTGMTRLQTVRVSKASAEQRAGRSGRLAPGVAYRLWSREQQSELSAYSQPEIRQADLAPLLLTLMQWGVSADELLWLDPPQAAPLNQARGLLSALGACDADTTLTAHGEAMARLPVHPRLAHMLLLSTAFNHGALACDVAALLSERDPLTGRGADLALRLEYLHRGKGAHLQRLRQQARQFRRLIASNENGDPDSDNDPHGAGLLVALAYPDRIARRQGDNTYRLANGRLAELDPADPLCNSPWLSIAQLGGSGRARDRIFLAAEFNPDWLEHELRDAVEAVEVLEWQDNGQRLVAERQRRIGKLIIDSEPLPEVDDEQRRRSLINWLRDKGLDALPWTDKLRQWQQRVLCLRRLDLEETGESDWPDVSDKALLAELETWLLPFLPSLTHIRQLQSIDLAGALHNLLPWPLPKQLDEQAPTHVTVPTGSRIAIDYSDYPPVLAVKLQEMFGQKTTPAIAGGHLPLTLHLLSPARRPLQVTQDLASFWANAYRDVQKDMKGRYPKHPWPDDPANAEPKRGTKKQGA